MKTAIRFATGAAIAALAGCTLPGGTYVGGGALPLSALAVTQVDAQTKNVLYDAYLSWPKPLNAANYEIQRKIGTTGTSTVVASQNSNSYTDNTVGAGQSFTYTVRALSGTNQELTVSNSTPITVLAQQVAAPTNLTPAANATVPVGTNPTFSWNAVPNATWYYVKVTSQADGTTVYSALTANTSIQLGATSPLSFTNFGTQFPVGSPGGLARGIVYSWNVEAIRADNPASPDKATALDINPAPFQTFSQS